MDEDLQQLARELRKETCPQRVLDEVARRISAQTPAPNPFRYGIAAVLATLVVLCAIAWLRWPTGADTQPASQVAEKQNLDRVRIAQQVEGTFAYIGQVMVDARAHSEKVLLNDAVPQLRNSFQTAKNKIMNRIDL
jgi:hypothetical protein